MMARAASNFCLLIMIRAGHATTTLASLCGRCLLNMLTRLWEEEQEDALEAGGNSPKRDHPSPTAMRVCECCVDAVRDDLTSCDRNNVYDDHTTPETRRGELLDVERGDTCSDSNTNTDEETAANLNSKSCKLSDSRADICARGKTYH